MNVVATTRAIVLVYATILFGAFALTRLSARRVLQYDPVDAATKLRQRRFTIGLTTAFVVVIAGVPTGLLKVLVLATQRIPVFGFTSARPALLYTSVLFGPVLVSYVVVSIAMLPAWRELKDVDISARSTARDTTLSYLLTFGPKWSVFVLAITLPPGPALAVGIASAYVVYTATEPWLFERVNDTRALSPDERERLNGISDRDVPVRVVDASDAKEAQGFAIGFVPGFRRVYLTDYLLEELPDAEVRAVTEHEFGHLRRGHLVLRNSLSALLLAGGGMAIAYASTDVFLVAAVAAVPCWLMLAAVCRWTEYDADRIAADCEGGAAMSGALDAIAERNLLPRQQNLVDALVSKHPSVEKRTARLVE